ncbi:uncharacterized protein [Procambarus clarkii]|uniref:uncharacterized protein n=1 Tax=Procambarus clarkii TaxID=6728 RepID=UPI001E672338|nr:uncharacterized protein LOC123745583 [Procambarus clarkii]
MTSYVKGLYEYMRPGSNATSPSSPTSTTSSTVEGPDRSEATTPTTPPDTRPEQSPGYLKRAVSGVASGIYTVGSSTVGAGVTSVKWVAGTTYSVGAGVVGTAGSVVVGTAGTVASGASAVISKVTTAKKKEHSD